MIKELLSVATRRTNPPVVIASQDDDSFLAVREVPKPWQWLLVNIHIEDQVGQETWSLIGLRYPHPIKINPMIYILNHRIGRVLYHNFAVG